MRISFISPPPDLSGGVRVIGAIARGLQDRGHEVGIYAPPMDTRPRGRRARLRSLVRSGLGLAPAPRVASHPGGHPLFFEVGGPGPLQEADLPDADVVVATWWETAEWVRDYGAPKGVKAQFIQQFEANMGQPLDRIEAVWRLPMHKIVCSGWLADLASRDYGDHEVDVVPNGVDTSIFHADERGKQARPTVGLMYSKSPAKSWGTAVAALAEARRRIPELRILVYGSKPPNAQFPLPEGVEYELQPSPSRMRAIYAGCDAWLCASSSEGFHLPPHEAMACRCPVVSTRVGGPMDLVQEGINGFLVGPLDAAGLADRLVRVLTLPDDRWRAMSQAALAMARNYTWEEAAARFEDALNRAIDRARHGEIAGYATRAASR